MNSLLLISLLSLLNLFRSEDENFVMPLNRREIPLNFFNSISTFPQQASCLVDNPEANITKKSKKRQIAPEICFIRNLFYNAEVSIGSQESSYELALDLLSPFTWVKSSECKSCKEAGPNKTACLDNCKMDSFVKTHKCLKKQKCKKTNISASLDFSNHNFGGKLTYETLFLKDKEEEQTLILKKFKLIDVESIYNSPNYMSDGGLGLSMEEDETKDEDAEEDSGIVNSIINADQKIESSIFSIYIRENLLEDSENTLYRPSIIFGSIEPDFQRNEDVLPKFIEVNKDSLFDWDLPLKSISVKYDENDAKTIKIQKNSGILTLDTTFIAFPEEELRILIERLNEIDNFDCSLDKEKFGIVLCKSIIMKNWQKVQLRFSFSNENDRNEQIFTIDPKFLIKSCEKGKSDEESKKCYLQIHSSTSKSTVLGEAFLINFYTVFDMENSSVGFSEAVTKETETVVEQVKEKGRKYSRFIKYFFIIIGSLLLLLCPLYIYQLYKIIKRKRTNVDAFDEPSTLGTGEDAYDFQQEMKEKMEARRKKEEENNLNKI